jgi:hypothetical protein
MKTKSMQVGLLTVVLGTIGVCLLANEAAGPGGGDVTSDEVNAAVKRTAEALKENSGCPTDAAEFERTVAANWRHLHPKLDAREREKDPAHVEAHRAASFVALSAREIAAELMKDPSFVANRDATASAMRKGLVSRREAEETAIKQAEAVRARQRDSR